MWNTSSRRISSKIARVAGSSSTTLAVDREAAGGGFLGDMQEREQPMVGLAVDAQIVEAVAAGQRVAVEQTPWCAPARAQQGRAALAEQIGVAQLVDRVLEIEPAQQRIGRDFGGAEDVASAVGLDVGKRQQLAHAAIEIAPDPPMNRPHADDRARRAHQSRHEAS